MDASRSSSFFAADLPHQVFSRSLEISENLFYVLGNSVSFVCLLVFVGLALYFTWRSNSKPECLSADFFFNARNTQSYSRTAWSYFAGSFSSWALVLPFAIAHEYGWSVVIIYPLALALPYIAVSVAADKIQQHTSQPKLLSDFVLSRYGKACHYFIGFIFFISAAIYLISEYSLVAYMFEQIVSLKKYYSIPVIGILSLCYTSVGGLQVSIVTDTFQGILTLLLTITMAILVAVRASKVSFFSGLEQPPEFELKNHSLGLGVSLFLSLLTAGVFYEVNWQRAWAARSRRDMYVGSILAAVLSALALSLVCLCALYTSYRIKATGKKKASSEITILDALDANELKSFLALGILVMVTTMSLGAIDSLQNALAALAVRYVMPGSRKWMCQAAIVLLNVPLMLAACFVTSIGNLYLLNNMICACASLPLVSGLLDRDAKYIGQKTVFLGVLAGALAPTIDGLMYATQEKSLDRFVYVWWSNEYGEYRYWIETVVGSALGVSACVLFQFMVTKGRELCSSNLKTF